MIDDICINFAMSYITNNIPAIKDLLSKKQSLYDCMQDTYQKALKQWCKNDSIRKSMSARMFAHVDDLKSYLKSSKEIPFKGQFNELVELWASEMRVNETCSKYILELKLDFLQEKTDAQTSLLEEIKCLLKNRPENATIKSGRTKHAPVKNYIRRYCTSEKTENNFYHNLFIDVRYTLADYITGVVESGKNKFILYSSAQTGKTTDLDNLCWELQESGLYFPVSFEVRSSSNLKKEDLPSSNSYQGKEIVVVIDALDEINSQKRDDLLEEIRGYAYQYPDIKMILSCRSNYRREDMLNAFQEIYLQELTGDDALNHINEELGNGNNLGKLINQYELHDFAKNPFFLNVLIQAYKDEKSLPKTKAEVYKLFIERSYEEEVTHKSIASSYQCNIEEAIRLLERIAIALSLMPTQTLSYTEIFACLGNNQEKFEECMRYDILRNENGRYSFIHNAFREWLVANYLYIHGINKAKAFATHPNGRIKPEWYNIIMLWLSMYRKEEKDKIEPIISWLKSASLELLIYIDKNAIEPTARDAIFKGLLLEYKNLGIRMSSLFTSDYKNLLDFGQSNDTVRFITDELKDTEIKTAYYADLMCICYFLNWKLIELSEDKTLLANLLDVLEEKMKLQLTSDSSGDLGYIYLENQYFSKEVYVSRFFNILGSSSHCDAINAMIKLIERAGLVDQYIDYILSHEQYVHNQQKEGITRIVSRSGIYSALRKARQSNSILNILSHNFNDKLFFHDQEWKEYLEMMKILLDRTSTFINEGKTEFIVAIENYYLRLFGKHYSYIRNINRQNLLTQIRLCYRNSKLADAAKNKFLSTSKSLFTAKKPNRAEIKRLYALTGLWIRTDDVDDIYKTIDLSDPIHQTMVNWLKECPYTEVVYYVQKLYQEKYPELEAISKNRNRQQNKMEEFTNYETFKQAILEVTNKLCDTSRKKYRKQVKEEEELNEYIFRFLAQYKDQNNQFIKNDIIKGIKNKHTYNCFFMAEIANLLYHGDRDCLLTEELKQSCFTIAKQVVNDLASGKVWPHVDTALKLLLYGYFKVSQQTMEGLIDYFHISISKKEEGNFCQSYSIFDYLKERLPHEVFADIVQKAFNNKKWLERFHGTYQFADYLISNKIESSYDQLLEYIVTGSEVAASISKLLIKNGILIEELKLAAQKMELSETLDVYKALRSYTDNSSWIKQKLEPIFTKFDDYDKRTALSILTEIGSIKALDYINNHIELLKPNIEFYFQYDNILAASSLCSLIKNIFETKRNDYCILDSIFSSLEAIAIVSEENLKEVKKGLYTLTSSGSQFKFVNRYIINFENKYYIKNEGISDVNKVIEIIDTCMESISTVKPVDKTSANNGDIVVYISYN